MSDYLNVDPGADASALAPDLTTEQLEGLPTENAEVEQDSAEVVPEEEGEDSAPDSEEGYEDDSQEEGEADASAESQSTDDGASGATDAGATDAGATDAGADSPESAAESDASESPAHQSPRGDGTIIPDKDGDPTLLRRRQIVRSGNVEMAKVTTEIEATDGELSLAKRTIQLDQVRNEKKAADKEFNDRIKELEKQCHELAIGVRSGRITREVKCEAIFNWDLGLVELYELFEDGDLGECVATRRITAQERERQIEFDEERHLDDREGLPDASGEREQLPLPLDGQQAPAPNMQKCNNCNWSWADPLDRESCQNCGSRALSLFYSKELDEDARDIEVEGSEEIGIEEIEAIPNGEVFEISGRKVLWRQGPAGRVLVDQETSEIIHATEANIHAMERLPDGEPFWVGARRVVYEAVEGDTPGRRLIDVDTRETFTLQQLLLGQDAEIETEPTADTPVNPAADDSAPTPEDEAPHADVIEAQQELKSDHLTAPEALTEAMNESPAADETAVPAEDRPATP